MIDAGSIFIYTPLTLLYIFKIVQYFQILGIILIKNHTHPDRLRCTNLPVAADINLFSQQQNGTYATGRSTIN